MDNQYSAPPIHVEQNDIVLLTACMECTFYFQYQPLAAMRDLVDRAREALANELTHQIWDSAPRFSKITSKIDERVKTMFGNPRKGKRYYLRMRGARFGTSAASLHVNFHVMGKPTLPDEALLQSRRSLYEVQGIKTMPPVSSVQVTFPVDHPLAEPTRFRDWIMNLTCVKEAAFVGGHAGFGINTYYESGKHQYNEIIQATLSEALAKHPGLDLESSGSVNSHLLRYIPGQIELVPQMKRVQWLTFLRDDTLDLCGGREKVTTELFRNPNTILHPLPGALAVQAGHTPGIGDIDVGDYLDEYRHVAQVLAPARLAEYRGRSRNKGFTDEKAQAWLEAFQREIPT